MSYAQSAPQGSTFSADAFGGQIGKEVPVNIEGQAEPRQGRITGVEVAADGQSVEITVDVDVPAGFFGDQMPESFGAAD